MKKVIEHTVLLLFLIPLFFINIKSSHDWGDDFAQYIHQAKNISEGISQNNTGYVFNSDVFLGPNAYPTGFPLLLAPIIKHYGFNFMVLNYTMTFFLVIVSLFGFLFLRKYFSFLTAFFTTLIIAYNPIFLNFKTEIVSDLAFTSFLLASIYLIPKNKTIATAILLGLMLAFLAHIRAIGLLVIFVFLIHELFLATPLNEFSFQRHQKTIISLFSFTLLYVILKFAFPCETNYPSFFEFNGLFNRINEHISYNFLALSYFFNIYEPKTQYFIGVIGSAALVTFSTLGYFYEWKKHRFNFINVFVLVYIVFIAMFQFGDTGLRFISPILFFIFYYAIIAIKKVLQPFNLNYKVASVVFGLILLFSYKPAIEKIIENQKITADGPCTDSSYEVFNFIKSLQLTNEVIVFEKPRALALFTNTNSVALKNDLDEVEIKKQLQKFKAKFVLLNSHFPNEKLSFYLVSDTLNNQLVFTNSEYKLFKLK
jgi:hypothetical protein